MKFLLLKEIIAAIIVSILGTIFPYKDDIIEIINDLTVSNAVVVEEVLDDEDSVSEFDDRLF